MTFIEQEVNPGPSRRAMLGGVVLIAACVSLPALAASAVRSLPIVVRVWPDDAMTVTGAKALIVAVTASLVPFVGGGATIWVHVMAAPDARVGGAR